MKKLLFVMSSYILAPSVLFAQGGLVPKECDDGGCGLAHLVAIMNDIIAWLITFTTSVVAIMFAYAGFLYITAQGDSAQVQKATGIFRNVIVGFVIILLAFLLIKELVEFLVEANSPLLKIFAK
jgi:hypothetical protein